MPNPEAADKASSRPRSKEKLHSLREYQSTAMDARDLGKFLHKCSGFRGLLDHCSETY
jgi:hypothetical protein